MKSHLLILLIAAWSASLSCVTATPRLFPMTAMSIDRDPTGAEVRCYDHSGDGHADWCEHRDNNGLLCRLTGDGDGDGTFEQTIAWPPTATAEPLPQLVIILDSVPYEMVKQAWQHGRLRMFPPPSRIISPFPVMTDVALSDFFQVTPCPGIEAAYYDGHQLTDGYDVYSRWANSCWYDQVDYALRPLAHVSAYTKPHPWFEHELAQIQKLFDGGNQRVIGYVVGSSALGSQYGRNGHQLALVILDRFCQELIYRHRGRLQITLLSDHGHSLEPGRRIPLTQVLTEMGYRLRDRLEQPRDVVLPQFGLVTCAALYTKRPAQLAADVVGVEGVELAAYRTNDDQVTVLNRSGQAQISRDANGRYCYQALRGDPLRLAPILADLAAQGQLDEQGFVDDQVLFAATVEHVYPDAVHRLWRAFHDLTEHTPDVLLSLSDDWHSGAAEMTDWIILSGAHGNLRPASSSGFVTTTADPLPPVIRMHDLADQLQRVGLSVKRDH